MRREESWSWGQEEKGVAEGMGLRRTHLSATGVFCLRHLESVFSNGTTWTQRGAGRAQLWALLSEKVSRLLQPEEVSFPRRRGSWTVLAK